MNFNLQPILENEMVILRPLNAEDFDSLFKAASDPLIWEQHQNKDRYTKQAFQQFFDEAIGSKGACAILDKKTNKIIGSSRFKVSDTSERVVEIGWSFLSRDYWGGHYNREFKKLMVNYALQHFDRVVFYVNPKNHRSQRALEKLGAKRISNFERPWVLPKEKGVTFVIDSTLK